MVAPRYPLAAQRLPATPRGQAARLPLGPGVYRFRDAAGRVLYLGRAVSLRRRVASYWGNLGDRPHLAAMVARIARVEAVPCASAHEAAWLRAPVRLEPARLRARRGRRPGRPGDDGPAWADFACRTAELAALLAF